MQRTTSSRDHKANVGSMDPPLPNTVCMCVSVCVCVCVLRHSWY